jgi:hypothetical protein
MKEADQRFYPLGVRRATEGLPFADEKNPARAYTLSLFFWGGGQSYSGLRMRGVLFQIFMFVFFIGIGFSTQYGKDVMPLLESYAVSRADVFLAAELLLFSILIFWSYNAADAYHAAVKARRVPFRGVRSRALPLVCSLLLPGWGQFMNGQPLKGSLLAGFSVLGIFSLVTVPCVLLFWPALDPSRSRSIIESIFTVMVLYVPCIPVISVVSGYDALKVSMDDVKKELLLDRIVLALHRVRAEGWVRSLLPSMKSVIVFALLIGLVLLFRNNHYFPVNYYSGHLANAQSWLYEQGMTLLPDFIGRVLSSGNV